MRTACRQSCYSCQSTRCHDDDVEQCPRWAAAGECATNQGYMLQGRAFSCRTCFLNATAACRRPADAAAAARPGELEANFARLAAGPLQPRVLSRAPWILEFDDFLTSAEADALVAAAGQRFEQSRFLGDDKVGAEGLPRTSTTAWCNVPACLDDATFVAVRARISALVGVPWEHSEHLQVLRYEEGQFYREHHDQIAPRDSAWGPRLYTFFMYLSDVEAGGATNFTRLGVAVHPRKGRAILWPSVLDADLHTTDERTYHEALPVERGTKFAANFWVHLYDFQAFHAKGCDNRDYLQEDTLQRVATEAASRESQ